MKNKKVIAIISITILTVLIIWTFIRKTYFFNPLTFRRDKITYMSFSEYKNQLVYSYWGDNNHKVKGEFIRNDEDIRLIYDELKKGTIVGDSFSTPQYISAPLVVLAIYSGANARNKGGSNTVTSIGWQGEKSEICSVSSMLEYNGQIVSLDLYVKMTPRLKEFFTSKFM